MKKNNVFKKTFLILILAVIPLMILIGAASWILLSEEKIKPIYNPNSAFYKYLNNQSVTYDGNEHFPIPKDPETNENNEDLLYLGEDRVKWTCFKNTGTSENPKWQAHEGKPVNAGEYLIRFNDTKDKTEGGYPASDVKYTINKAEIIFENLTCTYPGSGYYLTSTSLDTISYDKKYYFLGKNSEQIYVNGAITLNDISKLSVGTNKYNCTFSPTSVEDPYDINSLSYTPQNESVSIITYATVTYLDDDGVTELKKEYYAHESELSKFDPIESNYSNLGAYAEEKAALTNWCVNNVAVTFPYTVTTDVAFVADWKYIEHTLKFVNVSYNDSKGFIYVLNGTYSITKTIKDLPYTVSKPTSDIKYFRRWAWNGNTQEDVFKISSFYNYEEDYTDTYTAYWWDILVLNNLEYDYDDYSTTRLTYSLLENKDTGIYSNLTYTILDNTSDILNPLGSLTLKSLHNGHYYYGDKSSISKDFVKSVTQSESTNIAGSTYLVQFFINNNSGFVVLDNYTKNYIRPGGTVSIILKYKTAIYNSTNYTIEDAITAAGANSKTITLNGNSTNTTSYVETCFTNIDLSHIFENYQLIYELNKTTLLVPFNNSTSEKTNGAANGNKVYSALSIPNNITINVMNSSKIIVGGEIASQTKTNVRGVLNNLGYINVASGCSIKSYGFTKGTGEINLQNGSTATDCMAVYDWPGGTATLSMYNDIFPINAWSMHNISCNIKINFGAYYYAFVYIETSVKDIAVDVNIVHSEGSNCLFYTTVGGSYIYKYAKAADLWINNPSTYAAQLKSLTSITGNNQTNGQKDILEINGTYFDSSLNISFTYKFLFWDRTVEMKTDTSKSCPLPYTDIIIKSGASLTLSKSDYLFLPGTSLTVEENATFSTIAGVDLSFETYERFSNTTISGGERNFTKYCVDTEDAEFILNGTANIAGNIGGFISTQSTNSSLTITGSASTSFKSLINTSSPYYYTVSGYHSRAYVSNSTTIAGFNTSTTYKGKYDSSSGIYYWGDGTAKTLTDPIYGTTST